MSGPVAAIRRPAAFAAVAAATAALAASCLVSLLDLRVALRDGPRPVLAGASALEQALLDAPAQTVTFGDGAAEAWLITTPDCADCREVEATLVPQVEGAGSLTLHVLLVAPRQAQADSAGESAAVLLAKGSDWRSARACLGGARGCDEPMEPAEREGYLEWGRASFERIAASLQADGLSLRPPALIWREDGAWRVAHADSARALRRIGVGAVRGE